MSEQVYVVMGETGEYSDREGWPVLAYMDEADARAHVARCDEWALANGCHANSDQHVSFVGRDKLVNPHDERMRVDYTGVRYYVMPVPLAEGR
jgi:hypothetical protein